MDFELLYYLLYLPLLPVKVAASEPQFLICIRLVKLDHVDQRLGDPKVLLDDIVQCFHGQVDNVITDDKIEKLLTETRFYKQKLNKVMFLPKLHIGSSEKHRSQVTFLNTKVHVRLHHKFSNVDLIPSFEKDFFHVIHEHMVQFLSVNEPRLRE